MLQPEAQWQVHRNGRDLIVTPPDEPAQRVAINDVTRVIIATNDSGPWGADVWFIFVDDKARRAVSFPQGATGEQAILDWLLSRPGFDHDAMIKAMGSTENAEFVCWRR